MTKITKEIDLHKRVEFDKQFEDSFVSPINFICGKIGWVVDSNYGTGGSLEDFFS